MARIAAFLVAAALAMFMPIVAFADETPYKVGWVTSLANVYLNGVPQASGFSFTPPNTLTFASAPGAGVVVAADFSFAFNCRFLDDQMDFEEFMANLWQLASMKFRSVKP